jgi:hypothetical protein
MEYGCIVTSVADIWKDPSTESERYSQVIYGEEVKILGNKDNFIFVESRDGVKGYIKKRLIGEYSEKNYKIIRRFKAENIILPFGSYINDADISIMKIPETYVKKLSARYDPVSLTKKFIGVPYLWGGTSDFGFDCSGLTQRMIRFGMNYEIPRNSGQQRDASIEVKDLEHAKRGDLIFFGGHVGFYLGKNEMLHANGSFSRITINNLKDGSEYSNMLLSIMQKIGRFKL